MKNKPIIAIIPIMSLHSFSSRSEYSSMLKLMQLSSPTLPIGAFSYSQGMEYAVSAGWVCDEKSAAEWIQGLLENALLNLDIPILARLYKAWDAKENNKVRYWNDYLLASRDTFELQEEERQLGKALARLLADLEIEPAGSFMRDQRTCYLTFFTLAAVRWNIPLNYAANGFLWVWLENQVLTAIKLVPLGQTTGQKILSLIMKIIPETVFKGMALGDDEIGFTASGQGIASMLHETQYTRLFRS